MEPPLQYNQMRIATWNVNSINARLDLVLDWIRTTSPHIVLLQELKCINEQFPDVFEDLGYNVAVYGQRTYNGVAILSKSPLEDIQYGIPEYEDESARYIEAFTNGLRVASVYVPNGQEVGSNKFLYKMEFFDHLAEHLGKLATYKEKCMIGGDFNVAPKDKDIYNPDRFKDQLLASRPERNKFQSLLKTGFFDVIPLLYPNQDPSSFYTWWDYRMKAWSGNRGLRIDFLLASPDLCPLISEAAVDREWRGKDRPSDHAPLWCNLLS